MTMRIQTCIVSLALLAAATALDAPQALKTKAPRDPELIDVQAYQKLLKQYHGKALLVTFWATWCEPCRAEYPMLHESPHQDQIPVIVHAHTHDLQSLRGVLLRQFIQHGVLVAAWFAPRRPKRHEQRFPMVLLEQFLISLHVNQFWIARSLRLQSLRCSQGSRRGQQSK